MVDVFAILVLILVIIVSIVVLIGIGYAKLKKLPFKFPQYESYDEKKERIKEKLISKYKSIKHQFKSSKKESELTRLHRKLKENNSLDGSHLNVFESDKRNILNEDSYEESSTSASSISQAKESTPVGFSVGENKIDLHALDSIVVVSEVRNERRLSYSSDSSME